MVFLTRIPTHDNDGRKFSKSVRNKILSKVRETFGGYSLDGPGEGSWMDEDGRVYEEPSYLLTVFCDRNQYQDARELVIWVGRELEQEAMYFEVRYFDGVEIIEID